MSALCFVTESFQRPWSLPAKGGRTRQSFAANQAGTCRSQRQQRRNAAKECLLGRDEGRHGEGAERKSGIHSFAGGSLCPGCVRTRCHEPRMRCRVAMSTPLVAWCLALCKRWCGSAKTLHLLLENIFRLEFFSRRVELRLRIVWDQQGYRLFIIMSNLLVRCFFAVAVCKIFLPSSLRNPNVSVKSNLRAVLILWHTTKKIGWWFLVAFYLLRTQTHHACIHSLLE